MLTSVLISNVATFTGKAQEFGKLEKVNFVYGANGCGKTTISRVIAHPEQHKACSLEWEGNIPLQTLVYNRDFIEDNFKTLDSIKGIFTLGTEDDDIRASIDERRRQMNECDDDIKRAANNLEGEDGLGGKKHDLEKQNEKIEEYCWEQIKKPYDADFQKAFEGLRNNKKRFADEFVGKSSSQASVSRTKDELIDEAQTVFGEQKNALHRYEIPDFESFRSNLRSTIYTKTIVGGKDVDIAEMISRLGNSDWVRHGQHQLRHTSGKCPFCQQDLPSGFAEKLEQYFDETFMADVAELKEQNGLCVRL